MMSEKRRMLGNGGGFDLSKTFDRDMVQLCPPQMRADEFRALSEVERRDAIISAATAPEICGPDIPVSPARGAFATFQPRRIVPGSAGTAVPDGYRGHGELRHRSALRSADVFDAMEQEALRRHQKKGDDGGPFTPPLTPGQVTMGRIYRNLVEDHDGKGVKCASLEASSGGGGSGSFIDTFVAQGIAIERIRARIGLGMAMQVRRIRPSKRGEGQLGNILDRHLVDMVCLGNRSLTDVLRAHGWSVKAPHLAALRTALAGALDRMQGYRYGGRQNMG
jgi:hypothetical protein